MSESNVAQDQIKAYVDRILRMKEEAKSINADIREIYAEAKGNGFDKTVLGKLVTYVEKRQTDASAMLESESLFDLYLEAYDSAVGKVGTKRATHAHAPEKPDPLAALRADPALSIVDPSDLKKSEPQPSQPAGSDLAAPQQLPQGQVAPTQPETANVVPAQDGGGNELGESLLGKSKAARPASVDADVNDGTPAGETGDEVVTGGESAASKYAAPGEITWETFPPEGVERSAISTAFGTMGQDLAVIEDELSKASAQPIVKKGNVILDGWARFMAARNMRELDGSPMAYPVVQYAGNDLLTDIIKLNVEGRMLTEQQKRLIAANLSRQEPSRKEDIYRAFELFLEPV